ncbi:uncharacterized protein LOC106641481 [Copidosoma floridanum]|uniref:uncharacterized protein LOC106641481 n=1 Tax=Copidosoma floridanum TaxID=29053 RepID=UPI0006C94383|nr:uncharacterized protein LOC106641481 [Copidosoma floridanum]
MTSHLLLVGTLYQFILKLRLACTRFILSNKTPFIENLIMQYVIWSVVVGIVTFIIYKANSYRHYFKKWGIPQPRELPFLGIYGCNDFASKHMNLMFEGLWSINREAKYIGFHMFTTRTIVVRDLELIKSILVKNFDHFSDTKVFVNEQSDPLFGKSLAFLNGDKWREIRNLLSFAFTSSKMHTMFGLMEKCAENFSKRFVDIYSAEDNIDMKDVFARYSNDVIASCAFGLEIDSLENPDNEFFLRGKRSTNFQSIPVTKMIFMTMFPGLSQKLGLRFMSKDNSDYFVDVIRTTIATREKENIKRPDMLQILMEARNAKSDAELLEIAAQAFIFFVGGFDTTSSHMCCIAHALTLNLLIQQKLRNEIDGIMKEYNGKPTYEAVNNKMPYMDAVFNETLRLFPISVIQRVCSKEFVLPPCLPEAKSYTVNKGDEMAIPLYSIHTDPRNYKDPKKFDPERFFKKKISTTDATLLGFGMGPRMCIGYRFAVQETKILFLHLLSRCELFLCKKSPEPFEYDVYNVLTYPKNGFWLKINCNFFLNLIRTMIMAYWIWLIVLYMIYVMINHYRIKWHYVKQGVPLLSEVPVVGAFGVIFFTRQSMNDLIKKIYSMNQQAKYSVSLLFSSSLLIIRDLDLIKSVLIKNFDHFADRKNFTNENNDPLFARNLAQLNGDKWHEIRNLLSPAFTSSKMRAMHVFMRRCAVNFTDKLLERYGNMDAVDMKDVFSRFTNDVIATCAFGIEVDSLENPNNEFFVAGKKCSFNNLRNVLKVFLLDLFPKLTAKLGMRIVPKKETKFFVNVIEATIKTRQEQGINRPDMLQLMIDTRDKMNGSSGLDTMELTAQAFIFFLAGFDTTSDLMSLIAHELAANPDVQEKLKTEVDGVIRENNGEVTYEAITNMHYLDAVFNETMRMHPSPFLTRVCSKDFELPPSLPNLKPFLVKTGTEILIPSAGVHRDPNYYENPDKFDPDRYLNKKITSDVLNLGFGLGPRMCIGNRFGILEIKTLFVHMLAKCSLEPCKKTCLPFKYDPSTISPCPKGGCWLKLRPGK